MNEVELSIITINLNNKLGLKRTIESVINQTYKKYEYIIIDGGSKDGSLDLIMQYDNEITYWISEPDRGIYNAMNKGILKALGKYCFFLNSGDFLINDTILCKVFSEQLIDDIIYGNVIIDGPDGKKELVSPSKFSFDFFLKWSIPHQVAFIKRKLFDEIGLYNESLKIKADWEFFALAIFKYNYKYKHLKFAFSEYNIEGFSSNPENVKLIIQEMNIVLNKYFYGFIEDYEELERLRCKVRELRKSELELRDIKMSVFYKYGYKIGQSIKKKLGL